MVYVMLPWNSTINIIMYLIWVYCVEKDWNCIQTDFIVFRLPSKQSLIFETLSCNVFYYLFEKEINRELS